MKRPDLVAKNKLGWNESQRQKLKQTLSDGRRALERNANWHGGVSFIPYSTDFNKKLKLEIRKRDNYTCQECGITETELKCKLHIHHIDYCKTNCNENNLMSLCSKCHKKTNFEREDWTEYYLQVMVGKRTQLNEENIA